MTVTLFEKLKKKQSKDSEAGKEVGVKDNKGDALFQSFDDAPVTASEMNKITDFYSDSKVQLLLQDQNVGSTLYGKKLLNQDQILPLKFLRASSGNFSKAVSALETTIRWRIDCKVDEVLTMGFEQYETIKRHLPHCYPGFDKVGRPLYIQRLGYFDAKALMKELEDEQIVKYHLIHWEFTHQVLFPLAQKKTGTQITELVTILDMEGLKSSQLNSACIDYVKTILKIDETHYPEAGLVIIINASWVFKTFWKLISGVLNPRSKEKVRIFGSGKETSDALAEHIGYSVLPTCLGGEAEWRGSEIQKLHEGYCTRQEV